LILYFKAQIDAVRNEWQKFLNLCICQETHLDNVEEFKKYQMDTEQLSETLTQLNSTLDPKSVGKKSNSETLLQLEVREKQEDNPGAARSSERGLEASDGVAEVPL
ncbi:hypothetical protein AMECASPLE_038140, partial [Ameca splendens]